MILNQHITFIVFISIILISIYLLLFYNFSGFILFPAEVIYMTFEELMTYAIERDCSDVHITQGM